MKPQRFIVCAIAAASILFLLVSPSPVYSSPSTGYVVNSTLDTDDGTCDGTNCTLREAINTANAFPASISFDLTYPATITLGSALPAITAGYSIWGPPAGGLVIDGNGAATVFSVQADSVAIDNLSITGATTGIDLSAKFLSLVHCNIYGNGTGIMVNENAYLTADQILVSSNSGTGMYENGTCDYIEGYTYCNTYAAITNSTFTANSGGGIHSYGATDISNSTFYDNTTSISGGAIYAEGWLTIVHSTISDNTALSGSGGGIFFSWLDPLAFMMTLSIVSDNDAPIDENCNVPDFYITNSLQYPGDSCGASTPIADPLLLPLGYYGGPTPTMPLLPGSPAIDAAPSCGLGLDQRGFPRPVDGDRDGVAACDLGAFEAGFLYGFLPLALGIP